MEWLDSILEASSEAESPTSFILWGSICAISAVAKKNVYIKRKGIYNLFPNLYVLIVGPSGVGKSFPSRLLKTLVSAVNNTRVISGQNTIQGVISYLKKPYAKGSLADNPLIDAHALLQSGEFSNLIMGDPQSLTILTEWYDTHDMEEWKKKLRDDEITLSNVCITMFGATNEKLFRDRVLDKDIEGGFMARTLVVHETKRSKINALVDDEADTDIDIAGLSERLREISKLNGRMLFTLPAKSLFKEWYATWMAEEHPWDRTGITFRIPDHVLKVATCISLSRKDDLVITEDDLNKAFSVTLPLVRNSDLIIRGKGRSAIGELVVVFMALIIESPDYKITRSKILREHYSDFDTAILDSVIASCEQAQWIRDYMEGNERWYELEDKYKEDHMKILGKK